MKNIMSSKFGRMVIFLIGFLAITFFSFGWDWDKTWKFIVASIVWIILFFMMAPSKDKQQNPQS